MAAAFASLPLFFSVREMRDAPAAPFLRRTAAFRRTYPLPARCCAGARGFAMTRRNRGVLVAICTLLFAADNAMAESGIASAYPRSYQGRRTASGEHLHTSPMPCPTT